MVDADEIYLEMTSILRCPRCDRLWVYWNGFQEAPQEYVRPDTRTPDVP